VQQLQLNEMVFGNIFKQEDRYCTGTVRCAMSVEILSTAAQLNENSHLKRLAKSNDREA